MCTSGFGGMTQPQISIGKRSEALREAVGLSWSPTERLLHESQLIAARSRLDEQTWEAAFAEGQAMTLEDAVEYAFAEDGHDPSTAPVPERSPAVEPMGNLTRREQEVATPVARGLTNRQISADLSISERTAANHVAKILRKLGLRSRAQIAARAGVIVDATEAKSRTEPGVRASDG
jgi:DNA-binding NarL/FixJ family response regulator